ncbi:hypothetical protein [Oceanobacillus sp. FSL H7-0719]|uniref:hypothetical protein n=1 Tax=Oceanobacillus sp. FSL H7-0719 TaxID=2954507 RepID=UPI003249D187
MEDKQLIEHLLKGIYEEIECANKMKQFTEQGKNYWQFEGKTPNKERFKRYRLILEEYLREVEKTITY